MSCHTWSYRKVHLTNEQISEIKDDYLNALNVYLTATEEDMRADFEKEVEKLYSRYIPATEADIPKFQNYKEGRDEIREFIAEKNLVDKVKSGDFEYSDEFIDTTKYQTHVPTSSLGLQWHNGAFYELTLEYGDNLCKVTSYPELKFTDADSLLEFLDNESIVYYYDDTPQFESHQVDGSIYGTEVERRIREAFSKYEPGELMIDFG